MIGNIYIVLIIINSLLVGGLVADFLPKYPTIYFIIGLGIFFVFSHIQSRRKLKREDPERYEREKKETLREYFDRKYK